MPETPHRDESADIVGVTVEEPLLVTAGAPG